MKLFVYCSALALWTASATAFAPIPKFTRPRRYPTTLKMTAELNDYVIDQERRTLMNWILVSSAATTVTGLAVPYFSFFMPPSTSTGNAAVTAKDALGQDVLANEYLETHPTGDRSLVQGLAGDATYLLVRGDDDNKSLDDFALNAICTHLGCVVPWSEANHKFICPCHGSQYDEAGGVVRGPAPLPLALAHVGVDDKGMVALTPWTELDFRTNETAWWN